MLLIEKEWKEVEVPIDFIDNNENLSKMNEIYKQVMKILQKIHTMKSSQIDSTTNLDPTNSNETKK